MYILDSHNCFLLQPGHYLGHLIGHEGPGSLLSELKNRGGLCAFWIRRTKWHIYICVDIIPILWLLSICISVLKKYLQNCDKEHKECLMCQQVHYVYFSKSSRFLCHIVYIVNALDCPYDTRFWSSSKLKTCSIYKPRLLCSHTVMGMISGHFLWELSLIARSVLYTHSGLSNLPRLAFRFVSCSTRVAHAPFISALNLFCFCQGWAQSVFEAVCGIYYMNVFMNELIEITCISS